MSVQEEVLTSALEEIFADTGELLPHTIVERAASESHPLHGFFEWRDDVAASKYRIAQAYGLIRRVTIKFASEESTGEVRAWHSAKRLGVSHRDGYIPDREIQGDPVAQHLLLRTMQREWVMLRRRYSTQAEFWSMVAIDIPPVEKGETG
jgi:hypothetical protein